MISLKEARLNTEILSKNLGVITNADGPKLKVEKNHHKKERFKIIKILLVFIGSISVALGVLGIVLPLLPTTPFLLLAAFCYMKSSDKFYNRLINNKWLGIYIKNYIEKKGIPLKIKIFSITFLWISIGYSSIFFVPFIWGKILLLSIAICVTIHILRIKTLCYKNISAKKIDKFEDLS
ncbi:UNVERIFIED_CONTAM: uncharacterized membrane protein YbaN (DUF454 family) [Acetivibrio alkalicellulosi]